jgi:molybdopterin-biosynthesis enzyme MoeA-like protein
VFLGMVVIGDEILNGFTAETNMAVAAKSLGNGFYEQHIFIYIMKMHVLCL